MPERRPGRQRYKIKTYDEHDLVFFTALRLSKDQLSILNIIKPKFQHFADPEATSGHHLKYQAIAGIGGSENDLVNGFFFYEFPSRDLLSRYNFRIMGVSHGFSIPGSMLLRKIEKANR